MFNLTGKTALVTGSSQGIGKEIAKALADNGAKVYAHGAHMSDKLSKAAEYIGAVGVVAGDLLECDVADKIYAQTGSVDILILNASVQINKAWNEFTQEDFDKHMTCNVKSSYFLIRKYYPHMKEQQWGRIVTIGSVNQYNNHPELVLYSASKAAQYKMVQNIAPAIAPYGVTINNIAPGAIDTPRNAAVLSDKETQAKVLSKIPAGFVGAPCDMNGAVLLLCSNEGRYITGSEIVVDGGMGL